MATVHFGRMSSLGGFNRTVAIKRMRRDIARDPEFVAMFLDEARLTSRIQHPNVVATLDVVAESGEVFLVMEYVRGESLQRLRRAAKTRREKVPVPVAISIMSGALSGLHAAHRAVGESGVPLGIVHRDVSPQNIMVGEDGIARITDFGIAKAESRLQVTHEGQMKGKLPYMAPEQLGSSRKRIDHRVDIFSAAVVLWELLAGKGLFRADHPGETIAKVLSAPIPALAPFRPDVSAELDRVLRKALSRKPDQRPQTAEEFALELEDAVGGSVASPRVVGAWVSSLAGDVLANRLRYIREMESTSWNMAAPILGPDVDGLPRNRSSSRDPDLVSDPSMRIQSDASNRTSAPVVPSPPPAPAPPVVQRQAVAPQPLPPPRPAVVSNPGFVVPPPQPSIPEVQPPPEAFAVEPMAPPPADESSLPSLPSISSDVAMAPSRTTLSLPPFQKNRRLPIIIVGALVAAVGLLLVVGVVSSASWFDEVPEPAGSSQAIAPKPPETKPAQTSLPVVPEVPDASPDVRDAAAEEADVESTPSENDTKGGSSGTDAPKPTVAPPPKATSKGTGTRPYLPDLP